MRSLIFFIGVLFAYNMATAQYASGGPSTYKKWSNQKLIVVQYPHCDLYNKIASEVAKERWPSGEIVLEQIGAMDKYKKQAGLVFLSVSHLRVTGGGSSHTFGAEIIIRDELPRKGISYYQSFSNSASWMVQSDWTSNKGFFKDGKEDWNRLREQRRTIAKDLKLSMTAKELAVLENSSESQLRLIMHKLFDLVDEMAFGKISRLNYWDLPKFYPTLPAAKTMQTKTLLIDKRMLPAWGKAKELEDPETIAKKYPYPFELVEKDDLEKRLSETPSDVLYLHLFFKENGPCAFVIDPETREILVCKYERAKAMELLNGMYQRMYETLAKAAK